MTVDPTRSTVVAWYDALPDGLAQLIARVQAMAHEVLGDAVAPRHPAQVHATLIGLERASGPFDPGPLAAHLHALLARPLTVQFGGFARSDRRLLSRGRPLHERGFAVRDRRAVLMGWPVVDGVPCLDLARPAELRGPRRHPPLRGGPGRLPGRRGRRARNPGGWSRDGGPAGAGEHDRPGAAGCARPLPGHLRRPGAPPRVDIVATAGSVTVTRRGSRQPRRPIS